MHKSIQNHHLVVGFITFRFLHGIRTVFGTVFRTVFKNSIWKVKILLLTHQKSSTPPTFVKQRFLPKKFEIHSRFRLPNWILFAEKKSLKEFWNFQLLRLQNPTWKAVSRAASQDQWNCVVQNWRFREMGRKFLQEFSYIRFRFHAAPRDMQNFHERRPLVNSPLPLIKDEKNESCEMSWGQPISLASFSFLRASNLPKLVFRLRLWCPTARDETHSYGFSKVPQTRTE